MSVFKMKVNVDVHDVDYNGVARFSSLMKYIQTAAQSQLTESGFSYDNLKGQKRAFILSRIKMEFNETVRAYDNLEAVSFPCHSRGFSFLRCYKLLKDGVEIGRAASIWALIDTDNHSLVRVNDFEFGLTTEDPLDLTPSHICMPKELSEVGTFKVGYGNTDQNRHLNNTKYPDMYSDFLPLDNMRIRSMSIAYMNEAPLGETLRVFRTEVGGIYYFRTLREDGKVNTEAEIELISI